MPVMIKTVFTLIGAAILAFGLATGTPPAGPVSPDGSAFAAGGAGS